MTLAIFIFNFLFKDGKIGIYDTKASGFQEDDNKLKAEALQKYIKEENKRKKKDLLIGGLVIKEGEHFRINSDGQYEPFKDANKVKGKSVKYGINNTPVKKSDVLNMSDEIRFELPEYATDRPKSLRKL